MNETADKTDNGGFFRPGAGEDLRRLRSELGRNMRALLQAGLVRMELVTREEYEIQARLLARLQERLEQLERRVESLERQLQGGDGEP
ncbi:MAG: accessory factor UbiK family protein [Gammaproteobacteria bacterium]|nr:accessory factor UbiK family protein [Gammaproteobacteria bacterium]MDD9863675.1 accessory factor UbiK family protein [Gammaproteobacteria bacterium]